jgi:hypothetical protein
MKRKRTAQSAFFNLSPRICLAVICAGAISAHANIITVTNTNDSGPGSLRQALADANGGDTINFGVNGTISLTSGELVIDKNITISGPGSNLLTVRPSQPSFRVFNVMPSHNITIQGLTISFGYAEFAQGGGIFLDEHVTATIADCFLTNNYTGDIGGAIFIDGYGGGAMLTVLNSTITGNTAGTTDHGGLGAGIYSSADTLTIINSTVSNNTAWIGSDHFGGYGGGIVSGEGTLEISNTTISSNQAGIDGGGLSILSGTATITNSTISGNTAGLFGSFQPPTGIGGGISNFGTLTIISSTISGNNAVGSEFKGGGEGGGIYGGAQIRNSTLNGNSANVHGGSIDGGTFQIGNTILNAGTPENIYNGTVTSQGYNVCSDDGGGFLNGPGDQINTDPMLGPLQNNGGPTFTYELLTGSPAIDAGDPNFTPPPYYDQRGPVFWRIRNGRIDVGSFEVQVGTTPSPTPTSTASPTPTPTATTTATATATPTSTATPTPTATATATATPTPTPTVRPTPTPRRLPTPRPRITPAPRP